MTASRSMNRLAAIFLLCGLAACGGSDGGGGSPPAPAPTPAPAGIGPGGGTVTGSNGATIVAAAGALAQTVNLQITEIAAGSANVPASVRPASAVYTLTPHGTTFAVPVTVSLPFDPAQVGAGRTLYALKTTDAALTTWGIVAPATISGTTASMQVTSFSNGMMAGIGLPTITTQPSSASVSVGQSATFAVVANANGAPLLTYQWQRNGVDIAGATSASYTLTGVAATDNGARFTVTVGNGTGNVVSAEAVLTVGAAAPGWVTLGMPVVSGGPVRLGALAVAPNGRVGVAYVAGSSGTAGLVGDLRVSEWDGNAWRQVGGALNLTAADGPSLASRSLAYDDQSRPVVAWLDRFTLTLVVQRWNGGAWERLGNPLFSAGAATADPQVLVDPITDQPIVVITSGPNVTVRTWDGAAWTPAGTGPVATALGGAKLIVSGTGQRLLSNIYGADTAGTQWLVRLLAPSPNGQYITDVTGDVLPTPIAQRDFFLDVANNASSAIPNAYALIGDAVAGPMAVRLWNGATGWQSVGGDLGIRNFAGLAQLRVTPFGLPLVAYRQGAASPRRVEGRWWEGQTWASVASPTASNVDAIGFALGLANDGLPYVALTQRSPSSPSQQASELIVRRFAPVSLSVVVNGPAGSGSVSANSLACAAGSTCDVPLPAGTVVVLDAAPAAGRSLQSWVGCDTVVALRCTVTVNQSRTVTATFQ